MKLLIPLALSFAISSCPNPSNDELPRNGAGGVAHADTGAELDRTLARELHFAPGSTALAPEERDSLDGFLLNADSRIRELKVILWTPVEADASYLALVQARAGHLSDFLKAHKIPYEILTLESPYYEDSQGSLLAVLD